MLFRLLMAAFLLLLSACSSISIPPYAKDKTLVVVPKKNVNSSSEQWSRTYYFTLKSLDNEEAGVIDVWLSNDSNEYLVLSDIPEGNYEIQAMKWRVASGWRATQSMDEGHPLELTFTVKAGQATIVPYLFSIKQESRGTGTSSYFRLDPMGELATQALKMELSTHEGVSKWLNNHKAMTSSSI